MQTPSVTPTETQMPPLELPTEAVNAPARMVWDGAPTYPGDSTPGYAFRVTYDSDLWAVTSDQFGFPALGHRNIEYCVITVTAGRGLPANISIEHDILYTDGVTFDVGVASENGIKKFVTSPKTVDGPRDYPRYNFESRVLLWFANQQHLY